MPLLCVQVFVVLSALCSVLHALCSVLCAPGFFVPGFYDMMCSVFQARHPPCKLCLRFCGSRFQHQVPQVQAQ
jgi:hypothetical protein